MKDGLGRKAFKFISRLRYQTDLNLTRKIKSARGEQFYRLTGSCRSCGKCCETPMIPVFPLLFFFKSVRWAIVTWHRMINGFEFLQADRRQKCLVFRCTHWDPVTKHCDSYETRPGMCRDYPRNLLDSPQPVFLEGCGYGARLKNSTLMDAALTDAGLPEDRLQALKQQLYVNTQNPPPPK
jgi:uncharacterized cysteine cluster protein YcgN (CxxCxxCC family)